MNRKDIFDSLFETDLERLEREFIIEPSDMLWELECKVINETDKLIWLKKQIEGYKEYLWKRKVKEELIENMKGKD